MLLKENNKFFFFFFKNLNYFMKNNVKWYQRISIILNLLDFSFEKIHTNGLLIIAGISAFTKPLDHGGFANRSIADYHHLQIKKNTLITQFKNTIQPILIRKPSLNFIMLYVYSEDKTGYPFYNTRFEYQARWIFFYNYIGIYFGIRRYGNCAWYKIYSRYNIR